jgi:hypothetical protein
MSTSSKLKQQLARPIMIGIISALGAKAMGQEFSMELPLLGDVSKPIFYGVLGVGSSLVSETAHHWILPYLPQSASAVKAENALLSPAIHGLVNIGVLKLLYPGMLNTMGYQEPLMIGVGAEIVGGYSFDNFVRTMDWMR